jgi:protein-L-isoaspartate(D-aspartate) O-methyltransferase
MNEELEVMASYTWTPENPEFNHIKQKLLEYYVTMNYANSQFSINAFERVARSLFVPNGQRSHTYNDNPLPIGHGQTISAPHMAFMECDALDILPGDKVLEIGSGSGYHASIAAEMCAPSNVKPQKWEPLTRYYDDSIYGGHREKWGQVVTVERLEPLVKYARKNIEKAGYADRITVIHGDGTMGLEAHAPYDKILVTAAGPEVPEMLKRQLRVNGRLIIPVGSKNFYQELLLVTREAEDRWTQHNIGGVVFVPLIGKYGFSD